jgi:hypothetical protein
MLRLSLQFWHRHCIQPGFWVLAVLAYVLFAVAPHDYFIRHEHAGGGHGHEHSVSSYHQANLERQVMSALGGVTSEMENHLSTTEGESESVANLEAASVEITTADLNGAAGIRPFQSGSHSHFFSDPNLVALVFVLSLLWVFLGKAVERIWNIPARPSLRLLPALARGPPRLV